MKWIGTSLADLREFPEAVKDDVGSALRNIQFGVTPDNVSHLRDGVYEIKENHIGETYRAVYIAKFEDYIYVLHCFHKKSKSGIRIPKKDENLIWERFRGLKSYLDSKEKGKR